MDIWQFIQTKLIAGQRLMLLVVLDSQGSSAGQQGFKMAVAQDGATFGTIGGGIMEFKLVQRAGKLLEEKPLPFLLRQHHDLQADENRSGMICSGSQSVAFIPLDDSVLPGLEALTACIGQGAAGLLQLSPTGFAFLEGEEREALLFSRIDSDTQWVYEEVLGIPNTLLIFGGGHISLAVSRQFQLLGFQVAVFDNRPKLPMFQDNAIAGRKEVVDYQQIERLVPEGRNVYVVIMTASHHSDALILEQLLEKNVRYLGMLGSKNKVNTIFDSLRRKGYAEEQLQRVAAPIGLKINSHTAAEIAVSIAAEVIGVKNG
ncbi:MAG: XdhC family protein [Phaeodactylibacter sp.]|nr:XdhC family protein [Phaeodactylibacter sp.]MCB9301126.1 XdhC family protein [Lewinellaceae bacterium]